MATMTPRHCLLLLALAGPATALASACTAGDDASRPVSDIDYPAINQALLNPDPSQRLQGLATELRKLDLARAPEATLVRQRLTLAQAQTQAKLGMSVAAMGNLKRLPVGSPVAPDALLLLADIELQAGRQKAAVRWLRHLADLYPDEPLAIKALWRAAELNHPHSRQAIALWQEAARQADEALAAAQDWQARSQQPDFMDAVGGDKLPPTLWRLARSTFLDPAFASADAAQSAARRQLQCMTAADPKSRRDAVGGALADLDGKVGSNRKLMHSLLQQRLEAAVQDLQDLSAEAHFRLAEAQEPRLYPGQRPN